MPKSHRRRLTGGEAIRFAKQVTDPPTRAVCRGGLKTDSGLTLTHCRSAVCPEHKPNSYALFRAMHRNDGLGYVPWPGQGV